MEADTQLQAEVYVYLKLLISFGKKKLYVKHRAMKEIPGWPQGPGIRRNQASSSIEGSVAILKGAK